MRYFKLKNFLVFFSFSFEKIIYEGSRSDNVTMNY